MSDTVYLHLAIQYRIANETIILHQKEIQDDFYPRNNHYKSLRGYCYLILSIGWDTSPHLSSILVKT